MFELDASQPSPIAVFDCAFDAIKGAVLTDVWRLTKRDEEIRLPGSSVFDGDIQHKTGDLIVCLADRKIVATALERIAY